MKNASVNIFNATVPEDCFSLFEKNRLQANRVVRYLDFRKEDVSKAAGVPLSSVRYDHNMSKDLEQRIREWAVLINLVGNHFNGDETKTLQWILTMNPLLGNLSPRDMIRFGRFKKLLKFVINALQENHQ